MTQGLMSPETYYYRYVYADAVRAIDVLGQMDGVEGHDIAVAGASQGGGLCLAAAALSGVPRLAFADIPFLCDFPRSLSIVEKRPYSEISDLLRQRPELSPAAYRTLSYFDVLHLARRVRCRTVMTVALWDDVCPPSSIFGAFGQVPVADKRLDILPYHRHELDYQTVERRLAELATFSGPPGQGPDTLVP
jgi:cephalosporin-C deacetylase